MLSPALNPSFYSFIPFCGIWLWDTVALAQGFGSLIHIYDKLMCVLALQSLWSLSVTDRLLDGNWHALQVSESCTSSPDANPDLHWASMNIWILTKVWLRKEYTQPNKLKTSTPSETALQVWQSLLKCVCTRPPADRLITAAPSYTAHPQLTSLGS